MSESNPADRRRAERLKLTEHLQGTFDGKPATILEVGLLGALIEHSDRFDDGSEGRLTFEWEEEDIALDARIAHSEISVARTEASGQMTYLSGVEFESSSGRDSTLLKRLISVHVTRSIERMKENARGGGRQVDEAMALLSKPAPFLTAGEVATKVFLSCRLDSSGTWHRAEVLKPKQPPDGFTVPADYAEEEIALLCSSYEDGDADARQMIRICAEMALASGEDVPPPSFV